MKKKVVTKTFNLKHPSLAKNKNVQKVPLKKKSSNITDRRKYQNDTTLDESQKRMKRKALEIARRNKFKDAESDDENIKETFHFKSKSTTLYDEGISEEEDDDDDEISVKCNNFSDRKLTLGDKIGLDKKAKYEKQQITEKKKQDILEIDKQHKQSVSKYGLITNKEVDSFNLDSFCLPTSSKVKLCNNKIQIKDKPIKKNKGVEYKVNKLNTYLKESGIVAPCENDISENDSEYEENVYEDEDISDYSNDEDLLEDDSENEEDDSECEEDDSECEEDDSDCEEDDSDCEDVPECEESNTDVKVKLNKDAELSKSVINKLGKRVWDESSDAHEDEAKKAKIEKIEDKDVKERKSEVQVLRFMLHSPEYANSTRITIAYKLDLLSENVEDICNGVILSYLFEESLATLTNNYSTELVRFMRNVIKLSGKNSTNWLSIKSNCTSIRFDEILTVCTDKFSNIPLLAISTIYNTFSLLKLTLKQLYKCNIAYRDYLGFIEQLPVEYYPDFLLTVIDEVKTELNILEEIPTPRLCQKKRIKIVELLDADLEDKFDKTKNVLQDLKKRKKQITKDLMKDNKNKANQLTKEYMLHKKKEREERQQKTKEILNSLANC